jgi:hypothetical protein
MTDNDISEKNIDRLVCSAGPALYLPSPRRTEILQTLTGKTAQEQKSIWRAVTKSRITKLAAAAVLVIAGLLAVNLFRGGKPVELVGCRVYPVRKANYQVLGSRRIRLEQGEIFLEVCPAEEKVVVETPAGAATALGTKFYVRTSERKEQEMNKAKFRTTVVVVSGIVQLSNAYGAEKAGGGEVVAAASNSAPQRHVENLNARFGKYYKKVEVSTKPSVPAYQLPLDLKKVVNFEKVSDQLGLKTDEPLLRKNGFVVIAMPKIGRFPKDDIVKPYEALNEAKIPIFVTADTLLHLYHMQFDQSLMDIEEQEFYPDLLALSKNMQTKSLGFCNGIFRDDSHRQHREVARLLVGYASVAVALLEGESAASIPECVSEEVRAELALIEAHEGFSESPLFRYQQDYSQYVPRGHYSNSEELKRYFKVMMWYGRMTFLLKGGESCLVSAAEATRQTSAAALLTQQCICSPYNKLPDGRLFKEVLERIYTVTAFYVGLADDLGFEEYEYAIAQIPPGSVKLPILYESSHDVLRRELAKLKSPAIYDGIGAIGATDARPEELLEALDKSVGFRLMGQRFVPDSYAMGRLVFPTVGYANKGAQKAFTNVKGKRAFPRGLDVMALLGSTRARELLKELGDDDYGSYDVVFHQLKDEFDELSESDWNRNIYWSWLHALKPLAAGFGQGYPTFMATQAWRDKSLATALASWAQLRHDTILYTKQPVTSGVLEDRPVEGYVEPVPEFYARLLAVTRMTIGGLDDMKVLTKPAIDRLKKLEELIARLLRISEQELAHKELSQDDYRFIRTFGAFLNQFYIRYQALEEKIRDADKRGDRAEEERLRSRLYGKNLMKTTLIADVHTDLISGNVLEEGTGHVDLLVACYLQPDGRLVLGAGPVLSYHEFKHPMSDRLTDEKWRELLGSADAPPRPVWVSSFLRK